MHGRMLECREDAGEYRRAGAGHLHGQRRVLEIQAKLHRWAVDDPHRRFGDLSTLSPIPRSCWWHGTGSGATRARRPPGWTATRPHPSRRGAWRNSSARCGPRQGPHFSPLPSRERPIPNRAPAKRRRLGISAIRDRVVQASLKLVLEPIFEADFLPCSYGFRPGRRVHDAVAEVRHLTSHSYEWIVEGDIRACFDEISHVALQDRVRARIADRRVLAPVKAFLKAGILTEDGMLNDTDTGTPQGSILSPLLSNVALSVLDEHIAQAPGGPGVHILGTGQAPPSGAAELPPGEVRRRLDDHGRGRQNDALALREEAAQVLARDAGCAYSKRDPDHAHRRGPGLPGWRIQRHRKRGANQHYVYTHPVQEGAARCHGQGQDVGAVRSIRTSRWTSCWRGSTRC